MEASQSRRFGPGPGWVLMMAAPLALALVMAWLVFHGTGSEARDGDPGSFLFVALLVFGVAGTFAAVDAWCVYEVDDDGLHRRRIGRRRFVPWARLSHVRTFASMPTRHRGATPGWRPSELVDDAEPPTFLVLVMDQDGRVAFRIPPWVSRRRQLAREIRRRLREARP